MKKKWKIYTTSLSLIGLTSLIGTAITLPIVNNSNYAKNTYNQQKLISNDYLYKFDDQIFDSLEEATNYFIAKNDNIKQDLYIGNINKAIFDYETQRLDITKLLLRTQENIDKLKPVFVTASGKYEHDYNKAKSTYINKGLVRTFYDNLNGQLFTSKSDALNSIRSLTNEVGITYYDINGMKINPLNMNDVDRFKNYLINSTINKINQSRKFDTSLLSIYSPIDENNYEYDEKTTSILKSSFNEIVTNILLNYYESKLNFINDNVKFNVNVSLVERKMGHSSDKLNYEFRIREGNREYASENMSFHNVNFNDLNAFRCFWNRQEFEKTHSITIHTWALNDVAEQTNWRSNFLGKEYCIKYTGSDQGLDGGVDIAILKPGTEKENYSCNQLTFKVDININNESLNRIRNNYSNYINDQLNIFLNNILDRNVDNQKNKKAKFKSSLGYDIYKNVSEIVYKEITNVDNWFDKNLSSYTSSVSIDKGLNDEYGYSASTLSILDKDEFCEIFSNSSSDVDSQKAKYNFLSKLIFGNQYNVVANKLSISIIKNIFNEKSNPLLINFSNSLLSFNFNSKPVFTINLNKIELSNSDNLIEKQFVESILLKNDKNNVIKNSYNISNSYDVDNNRIATNKFIYELNHLTNEIICKKQDTNNPPPKPNLEQNGINFEYDNQTSIQVYNENLKKLKQQNVDNNILQKSLVTDSNNILVLYNQNNNDELNLKYAKYLDTSYAFNTSLNKNIAIYKTEQEVIEAKNNLLSLEPATVSIFYNTDGQIINPGVMLDNEGNLITTSSAIYDSEDLIYDNLWRCVSVIRDTTKVFYEVDKDKNIYELFDAQVNFVYQVVLNNKNYYFATHQAVYNFVLEYVQQNTLRINNY